MFKTTNLSSFRQLRKHFLALFLPQRKEKRAINCGLRSWVKFKVLSAEFQSGPGKISDPDITDKKKDFQIKSNKNRQNDGKKFLIRAMEDLGVTILAW